MVRAARISCTNGTKHVGLLQSMLLHLPAIALTGTNHISRGSDQQVLPWRMKVWLVSSKMSQPSTIILSMARFFLMFSVSLTSSCMTLWNTRQKASQSETLALALADRQRWRHLTRSEFNQESEGRLASSFSQPQPKARPQSVSRLQKVRGPAIREWQCLL